MKRRWRTGVVKRIDRANKVLYADIDGASDVECLYLAGDPQDPHCRTPWPLALAYFDLDRGGTPLCMGPIGNRRVLFHDDFTSVVSPNGDTPWTLSDGTLAAFTGTGLGVAALTAATGDTALLIKDEDGLLVPSAPAALLLQATVAYSGDPGLGSAAARVGFFDDDALNGSLGFDVQDLGLSNNRWRFASDKGGLAFEGSTVVYDDFLLMEMLLSDSFAAGWLDGNGPATLTDASVLPDPGAAVAPFVRADAKGSTVSVEMWIDSLSVSLVTLARVED